MSLVKVEHGCGVAHSDRMFNVLHCDYSCVIGAVRVAIHVRVRRRPEVSLVDSQIFYKFK